MKLGLISSSAFGLVALALTGCSISTKADPGKNFVLGTGAACQSVACGVGETMQVCTTSGAGGECASIAYEVGGRSFACSSCSDCGQAAELATQACGAGAAPPSMGTSPFPPDAGSPPPSGGSTSCQATVACATAGSGYQECVTSGASGACASISFHTNDGQTFACIGCDCTSAEQQLAGYCEAQGPSGDDAGLGNGDAGAAGTTCSTAVACGSNGATYEACTTTDGAGGCAQISYQTSDGETFDCNGCSDCSSAIDQVTSYCEGQASSGGGGAQCGSAVCGSAASCCTCSGQPICYTLPAGYTCSSLGPTCS